MIGVSVVLGPILKFLAAFTLTFTIGSAAYQERFCSPQRANAELLMRGVDHDHHHTRFCFPRPLSRYNAIGGERGGGLLIPELPGGKSSEDDRWDDDVLEDEEDTTLSLLLPFLYLLTLKPLGVHYIEYSPPSTSTSSWGEDDGPID